MRLSSGRTDFIGVINGESPCHLSPLLSPHKWTVGECVENQKKLPLSKTAFKRSYERAEKKMINVSSKLRGTVVGASNAP